MNGQICHNKFDYYYTIQFTGNNTNEVLNFLSLFSPKQEEDGTISYYPNCSETCKRIYVQIGDFIVKQSGHISAEIYSEKDFNECYFINLTENLKCCGNCKHYEIDLEGEMYNGHSFCLHRNEHGVYPYKICENWQWNNRAFKDRLIGD